MARPMTDEEVIKANDITMAKELRRYFPGIAIPSDHASLVALYHKTWSDWRADNPTPWAGPFYGDPYAGGANNYTNKYTGEKIPDTKPPSWTPEVKASMPYYAPPLIETSVGRKAQDLWNDYWNQHGYDYTGGYYNVREFYKFLEDYAKGENKLDFSPNTKPSNQIVTPAPPQTSTSQITPAQGAAWQRLGMSQSDYWKNPIMPGEDFESYKIRIAPSISTGIKAPVVNQSTTNTNSLRYRPPVNLREAPIWNQTPNRITAPDWLKTLRRPFKI